MQYTMYVRTFGHSNNSGIGANHEHAEVRSVSCHAKYGRLEVLLMSCQINECNNLSRGETE